MSTEKLRLSKLMSLKNICSRREADQYIKQGLVYVDGVKVAELGTKVDPNSRVTLDSKALKEQKQLISIILNKPVGYVSSQPEKNYTPAIRLITPENEFKKNLKDHSILKKNIFEGLAVVGRLDIDSQGLLLFTQDGRLAKRIIGQDSDIEKEYLVRVRGKLSRENLNKLNHGLNLDGKALKPAQVEWINEDQLRFILNEGKKRQIRRMCALVNLEVLGLKRVRIGSLKLGDLPEGNWRFLKPGEIEI